MLYLGAEELVRSLGVAPSSQSTLLHLVLGPMTPSLRQEQDLVEAMIQRYMEDNGRIDEVAFFHGGIPSPPFLSDTPKSRDGGNHLPINIKW